MMIGSTASGCDELRVLFAMLLLSAEKMVAPDESKDLQGIAMAAGEDAEGFGMKWSLRGEAQER
jgi:hypothetical protein